MFNHFLERKVEFCHLSNYSILNDTFFCFKNDLKHVNMWATVIREEEEGDNEGTQRAARGQTRFKYHFIETRNSCKKIKEKKSKISKSHSNKHSNQTNSTR